MTSFQKPAERSTLHWTVRSNYRLRTISFAIMFVAVVFHAWDTHYGALAWTLIVAHLLLVPHAMYWLSLRAKNSLQSEQRNLATDCFLFGALVAGLSFPLWIGFTVYIASTLNITMSRGRKGVVVSQLLFFSGTLLGVATMGWQLSPETSVATTIVCILGNAFYMTSIAITAFRRNQQLRDTRESLKRNEQTLKAQIDEIQALQSKLSEEMDAKVERQTREGVRNQKLESLGSLVVGIAHEMNTPIGNAMLLTSTLDDELRSVAAQFNQGKLRKSELDESLMRATAATRMVLGALNRTSDLISSFKRVSVSRSTQQRSHFVLEKLVHELLHTHVMATHGQTIHCKLAIPENMAVDSYPQSLSQVLEILLDNCRVHGFEGRTYGTIGIAAEFASDGGIRLKISDDGKGIPPENLSKIFDPFFTTRLGSGGNGLGLSVAWNIVTGVLGGTLEVESMVSSGTHFYVGLPPLPPPLDH